MFKKGSIREKIKPVILGASALSGITLINFVVFPKLSSSYIAQFFEQKGQVWTAEWSRTGIGGNSIGHLIGDIISPVTSNPEIILAIYIVWTITIFLMMISYFSKAEDFVSKLSLGTLSYLSIIPSELNASTIALGIPSLYFLSRRYSKQKKTFVLVLTVFLPYLAIIVRGKILPLPETVFFTVISFFVMHSHKLAVLGVLIYEFKRKKVSIPTYKDILQATT